MHSTLFGKKYIPKKGIMQCTCRSDEVWLFVWCSAVFSRMKYPCRFWCCEKQSVRISLILKLLLNHKELERVFYVKKLCLIDTFPTAYDLNYSDKPFVKISRKNSRCLSKSAARFSKLTKNRKESQNHFNIWKLRLVGSFPTAYHTSHSDKRLENWSKNSTENFKKNEKQSSRFSKFETALKL